MVLTRSKAKQVKYSELIHIITHIVPEDIVNHIRSFLIPQLNKGIKKEYQVVKDKNGNLNLLCKAENLMNLDTYILCWNDIYKTNQYKKFTKYIDSTMIKLLGDKAYKGYFVKWLNSTTKYSGLYYQSSDDALLVSKFRNYVNVITY